jgi:hypothetical protein
MENCSKQSLEVLSNPYSAKVELSGDIPSLQSLCCNIFNQPRTIQSSLQILIQFNQLCEEAEVSQHFIQVRDINYDYLIEKFDFLYEHYDKHLLRSAFGEDQFNRKVNSMQERLKIERRYKELKGDDNLIRTEKIFLTFSMLRILTFYSFWLCYQLVYNVLPYD